MKHGLWLVLFFLTVVVGYWMLSSNKKPADVPKSVDANVTPEGAPEMPSSAAPSGGPLSGEITPAPPMSPPTGNAPTPPSDAQATGIPPQVAPVPHFGDPAPQNQIPYEPLPPPAQGTYEYDDIPPPPSQGYVEPMNPGDEFVDSPPLQEEYR